MATHRIRLHAAWKRSTVAADAGTSAPVTVALPDRSLLRCEAASVNYRRCFNRPTGLDPHTQVLLDCELIALAQSAELNGQPLALPATGLADITAQLRPHNELEIIISRERFAEASTASARLQIVGP